MLGRFPSVYFFHIPKCGGTTVADWLSHHVDDRRPFDPGPFADLEENYGPAADPAQQQARRRAQEPLRRQAFYAADVVATHAPLSEAQRDAAFSFTVLRDPAARVVSLLADWRRLAAHDLARVPHAQTVIAAARAAPMRAFLEQYGREVDIVDNYMTRTLAALSLPVATRRTMSRADLADVAMENLERRLDFVGVIEDRRATWGRLAQLLGLAPEFAPPRLNSTGSEGALAAETAEARPILDEITAYDRRVYDHACALFRRRDAAAGEAYDRAGFERDHAASATRRLAGRSLDGDIVFSVRDPFLGCGLNGRDGAGLEACCVWSGPSNAFVLYMPVPEGARLEIKLWVRGYASLAQRAALRVRLDGEPTPHSFAPAPGYAEVLTVEGRARRPFAALEVDIGESVTTGEPGTASFDARLRGLAFDRYGWRALPD